MAFVSAVTAIVDDNEDNLAPLVNGSRLPVRVQVGDGLTATASVSGNYSLIRLDADASITATLAATPNRPVLRGPSAEINAGAITGTLLSVRVDEASTATQIVTGTPDPAATLANQFRNTSAGLQWAEVAAAGGPTRHAARRHRTFYTADAAISAVPDATYILAMATSTVVTLPSAATYAGSLVEIGVSSNGTGGDLTIARTGSDTIVGDPSNFVIIGVSAPYTLCFRAVSNNGFTGWWACGFWVP